MNRSHIIFLAAGAALALPSVALAEQTATHVVMRGESLSAIAQNVLQDGARYPELFALNSAVISDPDLIYPGQILALPSSVEAPTPPDPEPVNVGAETIIPERSEDVAVASSTSPQIGDRIPEPKRQATNAIDPKSLELREIGWEELLPEGEEERLFELYQQQMALLYAAGPIAEGSPADRMIQIGTFNTVAALNRTRVRIPGYTVPFEYGANAEIREFLLVPYYGACLHAPPPPPNQTVFARTDDPIRLRDLAQAVWIEGTLYTQTQESELADAAYTIEVDKVEIYEY
ncbi:MAG: DUF3299 domain-containing protein [Pseudomonadota bacterium]